MVWPFFCWFGDEDRESQIRTKLISVQQQWHTQTQIEQTAPARHIFRTTTILHTLMKLCAALGWKVCCVSLHYNPNALEITHQTHSRYKTEFRGDAGWADSIHRQLTVQEASGLPTSPPNPVEQTCRSWSWVSVTGMAVLHLKACVPAWPSCCMDRKSMCVSWKSMSMLQLRGVM